MAMPKWVFKIRGLVMVPAVLFLALSQWGECENNWLTIPIGAFLFASGLFIRIWAQIYLHYRLKVSKTLTERGPYTLARNPIYIGNTLILLSLCFFSELIWFTPVMLAWCILVYNLVVRYEESHLIIKYGAPYQAYMARVPRWIPSFTKNIDRDRLLVRQYLRPSIVAELHCFLWIVPFILKECIA